MKFLCDRCKTRYSIADDRVRGKILKIRCKNCSAVITVREGMRATAPMAASAPAAGRAHTTLAPEPVSSADAAQLSRQTGRVSAVARRTPAPARNGAGRGPSALSSPQPASAGAGPGSAPATLDTPWYVSVDGAQTGPLSLAQAKEWVAGKRDDQVLYCWSEGFDEWLDVERVSHFRALRAPSPGRGMMGATTIEDSEEKTVVQSLSDAAFADAAAAGGAPADDTSDPLLASAMQTVPEEERETAPANGTTQGDPFAALGDHDDTAEDHLADLQLDIGEASRVVKLPIRPPRRSSNVSGVRAIGPDSFSEQRFGAGSGMHGALPSQPARVASTYLSPASVTPRRLPDRGRKYLVPVAAGGALVAVVVGVLLYLGLGRSSGGNPAPVAHNIVAGENLGYTLSNPAPPTGASGKQQGALPGRTQVARSGKRASRANHRSRSAGASRHRGVRGRVGHRSGVKTPDNLFGARQEVDLSAHTVHKQQLTPLSPDDLLAVYRAQRFMINNCYDRALKHDPLLSIRRARVTITIAPSGTVQRVSIPKLRHTILGTCLVARIGAWKLRQSSGTFTGQITMVFSK